MTNHVVRMRNDRVTSCDTAKQTSSRRIASPRLRDERSSFRAHGVEFVRVEHDPANARLRATKLTGDAHVPRVRHA